MKSLSAIYKGNRTVQLAENVDIPRDTEVLVLIPDDQEDSDLRHQLGLASESTFAKLWANEKDEVWREYL